MDLSLRWGDELMLCARVNERLDTGFEPDRNARIILGLIGVCRSELGRAERQHPALEAVGRIAGRLDDTVGGGAALGDDIGSSIVTQPSA